MILIDRREDTSGRVVERGNKEMLSSVRKLGIPADEMHLSYGDACFEGNGPEGRILVGVERKRLHDMLHCIDDARYSASQKIGMNQMYRVSFLLLEGLWKPHDPECLLMEGNQAGSYWPLRYRSSRVMYSKLFNYLISISLSNVIVIHSRDIFHSALNIVELYHYFQKRWEDHTSLLATQKLNIPDLRVKPPLVRKWAADLEGIGVKHSLAAEVLFKRPIALAAAEPQEWIQIPGVGIKTANEIVKSIRGAK